MRSEMVRYSKSPDKSNRKNTLVTLQEGDTIFFGIARCNKHAGDTFMKAQGCTIAKARALRAKIERSEMSGDLSSSDIAVHESNLRGSVHKSKVHDLLKYFDTIDDFMKSYL